MIISLDVEKAFHKIQHPFVMKIFSKLRPKSNLPNLIKSISKKKKIVIIANLSLEEMLRLEQDKDAYYHHFYFTL